MSLIVKIIAGLLITAGVVYSAVTFIPKSKAPSTPVNAAATAVQVGEVAYVRVPGSESAIIIFAPTQVEVAVVDSALASKDFNIIMSLAKKGYLGAVNGSKVEVLATEGNATQVKVIETTDKGKVGVTGWVNNSFISEK